MRYRYHLHSIWHTCSSNMYRVPIGCFRSSLTVFRQQVRACSSTSNANTKKREGQEHIPLDFSNTKEAYQSKSFREVLRHYVVFKSLSYDRLVDSSEKVCVYCYFLLIVNLNIIIWSDGTLGSMHTLCQFSALCKSCNHLINPYNSSSIMDSGECL